MTRTTYSEQMTSNPGTQPGMWNVRTAASGSPWGGLKRGKRNLFTRVSGVRCINAVWPLNFKSAGMECFPAHKRETNTWNDGSGWSRWFVYSLKRHLFFANRKRSRRSCVSRKECDRSCAEVCVCAYDDLVHSRNAAQYEDRLSWRQISSWPPVTLTWLYLSSRCNTENA